MISSPCKNCFRKDLSKEDCMKSCQLLREIQHISVSFERSCVSSRTDCTEENRYHTHLQYFED